ncbi:uncharacterized protein LOC134283651 [Saccostrea cucullata]|uniref:uncharacterized protein LOC134283651 n=1 Tax=Saccostrea cuccullata TaxID=36930 RepID=UPI002ED587AB
MKTRGKRLRSFVQENKLIPRNRESQPSPLRSPEKSKYSNKGGTTNRQGISPDRSRTPKNFLGTLTNATENRKVRFSKLVSITDQLTGSKAKRLSPDDTSPEPRPGQRKRRQVDSDENSSPSPERMGQSKRRGGIVTDHVRKEAFSPDLNKVPEGTSSEKLVKKPPTMIDLEKLLQELANQRVHGLEMSISQSPDSALLIASQDVGQIVEDIDAGKNSRLRKDIQDELVSIKDRVKEVLYCVDMYEEGEDLAAATKFPPINSLEIMKQRREKMYKERAVMQRVESYRGTTEERYALLTEVNHWLNSTDLLSELPSEEELFQMSRHFQEIHSHVMTAIHRYGSLSEKVMDLGNSLLATTHAIIMEQKEIAKVGQAKEQEKTIVIDERLLLSDQNKWDSAVKMVMSTFDDAMKWTKNATYKNIFKKGQSQFKELSSGMKKRNTELKEKRKAAEDAKMKLQNAKTDVEGKGKELEELKKNVRKITTELDEKKHLLAKAEENNAKISQKCQKQDAQIKDLQEELAKKPKVVEKVRAGTPPPPPSPPPPEIIKVIDSSTQLKLNETEKELEDQKAKLQKMKDEIRSLERLLRIEKERVRQLRLDLEDAIRRAEEAELTVAIEQPQQDPAPEVQIVETGDKDSTYYKTLLAGMKRDFNAELEKIKGHLVKERLRNAAMVKKVENTHKEQMFALQKDVVRVLRAIMHFRDHVSNIVEKESLKDVSRAMQALGSLIPDKLALDPKELLALLVGSVVEFMHKLEVIIANAFLTMRMMIKGSITLSTTKEVVAARRTENKARMEEAKKTMRQIDFSKTETKKLALRLKIAKEKLIKFEELTERQEVHDRKYLALLDRYRRVWKMYNNLNKDMTLLQSDLQEAVDEKAKEQENLIVSQIKMELRNRMSLRDKELEISVKDQKKNIRMLEEAYEKNKISKNLYYAVLSLLERSLDIPRKRLRFMMEQYIAFRSVKDTRARVKEILRGEDLSKHVRRDMEQYVKRIDEKLTKSTNTWHTNMDFLQQERRHLFKSIWKLFGEVFAESGLLLVHPLLNQIAYDRTEVYSKIAATVKRKTLKKLCLKGHKRVSEFLHLPTFVEGSSVLSNMTDQQSLWNAQFSCGDDATNTPLAVSPHLLNYDINRERIQAKRSLEFGSDARKPLHLPMTRNYYISNKQECVSV